MRKSSCSFNYLRPCHCFFLICTNSPVVHFLLLLQNTTFFCCARQGTCTSSITRSLKALTSQASPLIRQSPWDCFTSRPRVTWCLLPFSCSSNQATPTQYGLPEIRNMTGYWQRCGYVMLTIECSRYQCTFGPVICLKGKQSTYNVVRKPRD